MGVFFCKKSGPFLNAGCIMYSISIFYFTFYLFGAVYAPNAPPPLPTGLYNVVCMLTCRRRGSRDGQSGVLIRGRVVLVPVWRSEQP